MPDYRNPKKLAAIAAAKDAEANAKLVPELQSKLAKADAQIKKLKQTNAALRNKQ